METQGVYSIIDVNWFFRCTLPTNWNMTTATATPASKQRVVPSTSVDGPDSTDFADFYTIELTPIKCCCGRLMTHSECDDRHVVIVWEEMDDHFLLRYAIELKKLGMNPKVVSYERSFGPCIDYYVAKDRGYVE